MKTIAPNSRLWTRLAAVVAALGLVFAISACGSDGDSGSDSAVSVSEADIEAATGTIDVAGWQFYETNHQDAGSVESQWTYYNTDPDILIQGKERAG